MPVILLKNLDPLKLCNGIRLIVKKMLPHLLVGDILNASRKQERVLILRIPLIHTDLPFEFKTFQFPVRVSYAMAISKENH